MAGAEDVATPVAEAELMKQNIAGAQLKVIAKAGHYAVFEQAEEAGTIIRQFVDSVQRG
jgi:3-oxoadipate enol-lactonase